MQYPSVSVDSGLEIRKLSDREWRVCNADLDEGDAQRVLGYVERRGWYYELTCLRRPGERRRFASLATALSAAGE